MSTRLIHFNRTLTETDPQSHPVLIIGQLRHLSTLKFDHVKSKLHPRVNDETFQSAITCLHPSPTDFCPLYLDLATIAALPIKCSRHNTTSRAHALTRLVKTHAMDVTESIVVSLPVAGFPSHLQMAPPPLYYHLTVTLFVSLTRFRSFAKRRICLQVLVLLSVHFRCTQRRVASNQIPQRSTLNSF